MQSDVHFRRRNLHAPHGDPVQAVPVAELEAIRERERACDVVLYSSIILCV